MEMEHSLQLTDASAADEPAAKKRKVEDVPDVSLFSELFQPQSSCVLELILLQPFYDPLFGSTQVSRYQKDKPFWILLKQR